MDDALFRRADELFDKAMDLSSRERAAFLDRECREDPALRERVERLLRHAETGDGFLTPGEPLAGTLLEGLAGGDEAEPAGIEGRTIGRYRVESEIGRGGMAIVYLATRADGHFDQKVALKLVRGSLQGEEALRRFERERQILAAASHPAIARLFDGGVTPEGEPYFVMEHVEGRPIDRYCDEKGLPLRDRLALFAKVAGALAYAHRNLIVHRDIKPANILVTDSGDPKLLDFGIARPLGRLEDEETLTRMGSHPMTPAFASPEQIRGEPATTAVDIYQLGVLLYLLLCGRMPHTAPAGDLVGLQRSILEELPPRPSDAVPAGSAGPEGKAGEEAARRRGTTPSALRRALAGDLDNIVLKALRKEPERRYASVSQLIEDVESYLNGRTVSARPDTLAYRTSKFVRRHKVAVALGLASVWLLVAFALTMTIQAARIARERDRANRESAAARQVADLLVDLFEISDPSESRGNSVTAREILDRGVERVGERLADQPELRAELRDTLGRVYQNLGLYEEATPLLEDAVEARKATLGPQHPDTLKSLRNLAWLLEVKGDYEAAERLDREVLEGLTAIHGKNDPQVASATNNLALLMHHKGDDVAAETLFREALAIYGRTGAGDTADAADAKSNLGLVLQHKGDLEGAEALYSEALEMRRRILGEDHPDVAISLDNLGRLLFDRGDMDGAERRLREALDLRRRVLGDEHPDVSESLSNLGSVLYRKGDLAGAEKIFEEVAERDRRTLGESHPDYANSLSNLAHIRMKKGDPAGAEPLFSRVLAVYRAALPEGHWLRALALSNHGQCLAALGRRAEAETELLAGYEGMKRALGEDHDRTRAAAARLAEFYEAWGRPEDAERYR